MQNPSEKIDHAKSVVQNLLCKMCHARSIMHNVLCRTHEYTSFLVFDMFGLNEHNFIRHFCSILTKFISFPRKQHASWMILCRILQESFYILSMNGRRRV